MAEVIDLGDVSGLDRSSLVQAAYDFLDANLPGGYTPQTGALDDIELNANAQNLSEIVQLLSEFGTAVFRYYGLKVVKVAPVDAQPAESTVTFTAPDATGYLIPAGTELSIDEIGFATTVDANVAAGDTTAADVPIVATTAGAFGNDLSGIPEIRDNLATLQDFTVTLDAATANGQDAEDDDTYLGRLVDALQLLSSAAIVPADFVRKTLAVDGVGKVLALNLHNGDTDTDNQAGCITLAVAGTDGLATSSGLKTTILALFDEDRVLPLQVFVIDGAYTTVNVEVSVEVWPGFEDDTVISQVQALVDDFLDPLTWGSPDAGEGDPVWVNDNTVSLYQLAGVIERAEGVRRVVTGTLKIDGSAADLPLTGTAPLPQVGTVSVTTVDIG